MGRLLLPEEDRPGGDVHKALISYRIWQDRFGGDPQIAGRTIQTNQTTLTVVGVLPPGFGFPERTDVWTPMESYYAAGGGLPTGKRRDARMYSVCDLNHNFAVWQGYGLFDLHSSLCNSEDKKVRLRANTDWGAARITVGSLSDMATNQPSGCAKSTLAGAARHRNILKVDPLFNFRIARSRVDTLHKTS